MTPAGRAVKDTTVQESHSNDKVDALILINFSTLFLPKWFVKDTG